jgi:diguanylate cyclase (GGDEF)-like protein
MDWSRIPNVLMTALLLCAFVSLHRHSPTLSSRLWLAGWLMVLLHFTAAVFVKAQGIWGPMAFITQAAMNACAGFMFMFAAIPDHKQTSCRWLLGSLMAASTLYIAVVRLAPGEYWMLTVAAALLGLCPLTVMLFSPRSANHPLRWVLVMIFVALSIYLLIFQNRPGIGPGSDAEVARHTVLLAVFLACFVLVSYTYLRATAGAFITMAGFFCWAMSFIVMPLIRAHFPQVHIEKEVGDLPKFVVAVGMLMILLEDQIEHNKFLALHDVLTGLPNRRLFQDRLAGTLERARRSNSQAALLVVDLDHFKKVNDTMGHHVGDMLLQRVAAICSGRVRRSDTIARTGGDEFSVILEEPVSRADAERVGQSLIQLIKEPLQLGDHTARIGASVGIATFPEDAADMESLCIAADLRMYENKHHSTSIGIAIPALQPDANSGL